MFNIKQKMNHLAIAGAAGLTALAVTTQNAWAGDLAAAVTTEVATAKAEVLLVGVAVLGIVGVLLLIRSVKRAV